MFVREGRSGLGKISGTNIRIFKHENILELDIFLEKQNI